MKSDLSEWKAYCRGEEVKDESGEEFKPKSVKKSKKEIIEEASELDSLGEVV
jgi:hypothetical protein